MARNFAIIVSCYILHVNLCYLSKCKTYVSILIQYTWVLLGAHLCTWIQKILTFIKIKLNAFKLPVTVHNEMLYLAFHVILSELRQLHCSSLLALVQCIHWRQSSAIPILLIRVFYSRSNVNAISAYMRWRNIPEFTKNKIL